LGVSGVVIGAFSAINFQVIEGPQGTQGFQGPQGLSGQDGLNGTDGLNGLNGTDGQDAPGGIIVGILDPDYGETISGDITIRALIFGSENYSISILLNGTEIGTSIPMVWNSLTVDDGWWNITIVATDMATNNINSDEVLVCLINLEVTYIAVVPNLIIPENSEVFFNLAAESVVHLPNSYTNGKYCLYRFFIPKNYVTTENITFCLVWGTSGTSPVDYTIKFSSSTDGNRDTTFDTVISYWTGAGQGKRNFERLTLDSIYLNPGDLLQTEIYMEDQNGLENALCYAVWLEVPVI
jgi:hypothetical protein